MKKGLSEVVCIIDRSGSMGSIASDAIGGFNTFLEEQKNDPGETRLTYVQFNHKYEKVFENKNIHDIEPINSKTYIPSGMTALLDSVGTTISEVGVRLDNTPEDEKPENVIVCILTDGEENSSVEYTTDKIKEMIEHQKEKYNWNFIFLAANQDAFKEGSKLGIDGKDTFNYVASSDGIRSAYSTINKTVSKYKSSNS